MLDLAPQVTSVKAAYSGYLDAVVHRVVFGWIYDSEHPEATPVVAISVNGAAAGYAVANIFRADLKTHGIGDGRHAFEFPIPAEIESVDSIHACVAGTAYQLRRSSPEEIAAELNRPLPPEWRPVTGNHPYPNFFVLGAAKSGTTSLHFYLSQCKSVLMSDPKEPYFFEAQHSFGAPHYFNRCFGTWSGQTAVGEARHRNLYQLHVPSRIHRYNPDARLVVVLRNPVERAVSHWHWFSRNEEKLSLPHALAADLLRIEAESAAAPDAGSEERYIEALYEGREPELRTYLDTGYYMQQLDRYLALFGREKLHVILFEDLVAQPAAALAGVLRFLELDEAQAEMLSYPVCNQSQPGMLDHVNAELLDWLSAHYRPHNLRLEHYLGRSLAAWEQPFRRKIPLPSH